MSLGHLPAAPVAVWSADALVPPVRIRALREASDDELARLVEVGRRLERLHAWWLMGAMAAALLSVVVVGAVVESRWVFGAYAAVVAVASTGLGAATHWLKGALFRLHGREADLDEGEADRLLRAAADADHWLSVLNACGQRPSPAELASFVRHVDDARRGR